MGVGIRDVVGLRERRPALRGGQDFALVVGVDDYPAFRSLEGAIADATAFHRWVCDPDGGAVAPAHARLITSTRDPARPLQAQVDEALGELFTAAGAGGGGRRLYFYFAGHGAMCTDSGDDVALLLAAWSLRRSRLALSSDAYRSALGSLDLFAEIAMFLDCCRVATTGAVGMPPVFTHQARRPGAARCFVAYATEAGRAALERRQAGDWNGVFTQRLLSVLRRAECGLDAALLKSLLEHEVRMAGQRAHVVNGLLPESRFGRRGTPPTLEVLPHDEQGELALFDGFGRHVASHVATDGPWALRLPAGLYKLVSRRTDGGDPWQQLIDHGAATRLDYRPRLAIPRVHTWTVVDDTDRTIPASSKMERLELPASSVELAPGTWIHRDDHRCYRIESTGDLLWHHGQAARRASGDRLARGTPLWRRQLRDGDVFRCGTLFVLVGDCEEDLSRSVTVVTRLLAAGAALLDMNVPALSSAHERRSLRIVAPPNVAVIVYDAIGREVARGWGDLSTLLPAGLYRVDAEEFGAVTSQIIELDAGSPEVRVDARRIQTPAGEVADESRVYPVGAARYTTENTGAPLGSPPHRGRMMVFVDDRVSGPVEIHSLAEQHLAEVFTVGEPGDSHRVLACAAAPGTYVLRTRHDLAITIPDRYEARIFVARAGIRVSLVPVGFSLHVDRRLGRAMEHVIAAGYLPPGGVALARGAVAMNLCYAIAAAYAATGVDRRTLVAALAPFIDIPDVAILHGRVPSAPPLLRASLRYLLTDPAFDLDGLGADAPIARAACRVRGDPFWATWDPSPDADAWIAATLAALPRDAVDGPVALGRRLAIPPACIRSHPR